MANVLEKGTNALRAGSSYWEVIAGNSTGDMLLTIFGFDFTTPPRVLVFQTRQTENVDDLPDQFAIQVIKSSQTQIVVRIRRLDLPGSGWGQQLGLSLIVRE